MVGFDSSDDAAVYRVSADTALIQTVDFFPPVVDDPYDFGRIAASNALANLISDEELNENYIIPAAFDPRVGPAVAKAVAEAARKSGVARL